MKLALVSYREWALEIYDRLAQSTNDEFLIIRSRDEYSQKRIADFEPDLIFFYGWSWKIPNELLSKFPCVMLHPSPLPKYRGGSPIQNQIIRGETTTAVTLFILSDHLDGGDIIAQKEISLSGHLDEILGRLTDVGFDMTLNILKNGYTRTPQDNSKATEFKRRKLEESEITLEELQMQSGEYLYNKIRMLEDPYPNAFIRTKDGKKLLLKRAELEDS